MAMYSGPPPPKDTKGEDDDRAVDFVIWLEKVRQYAIEVKGETYRRQHHTGGEKHP